MPPSLPMEAKVWLQRYREYFARWARSSYADGAALEEAALALQSLLERCPALAAEVERIAAVGCFASRRGQVPQVIARLAQCGLEAGLMATTGERSRNAAAILLLSLAEAELHANRRLAGLDALSRLERQLATAPGADPLAGWVKARMHVLFAQLQELGLENEQACQAYRTALQELEPLLADAAQRDLFLQAWAEALNQGAPGKTPRHEPLDEMASLELQNLLTSSAIGLARNTVAGGTVLERASAARQAWRAIQEHGLPPDLSPFDMMPIIGSLPPGEAQDFGAMLVTTIEQQRHQLEQGHIPAGITDPYAMDIIRKGRQAQAELLKRQQAAIAVIATLGLAEAQRAAGDLSRAEETAFTAIDQALATRLGGPQLAAIASGFDIVAESDRTRAMDLMEMFLSMLGWMLQSDPEFLAAPHIRALFDRPLVTATAMALAQLGSGEDPQARCRASVLLDLLRRPEPPPPGIFAATADAEDGTAPAGGPLQSVSDTLGRIRVALGEREGTIGLVAHTQGTEVAFLLLRSDAHPVVQAVAGSGYLAATAALERAAYVAIRAQPEKRAATGKALEAAGRHAYQELPDAVRKAVRTHRTILLAPDLRVRQEVVPFELLHDGEAWLGTTRIVARFTSLAHMAATLETRMRLPHRKRALVAAAPVVAGYDGLDLAPLEQEQISGTLSEYGFDVPLIDPARLSTKFITDRLAYIDLLHVSAHGETGADLEWLVLPHGQRLVVDDLLQNPQYRVPFVYLNTCNLGQTRYLGAGVSRGLADTFAELGAPAVVAHTKPVSDQGALQLATAFYRRISDQGVGEALLAARQALFENGDIVAACASAVLIGDPDHRVVGEQNTSRPDLAADVLDAYFGMGVDDNQKVEAWTAAATVLAQQQHPRIAAAMGIIRLMTEVRDLQNPAEAAALNEAIAVADALHHLPARAMLRLVQAIHADEQGVAPEAVALLEQAIRYLEPLAAFEPPWQPYLNSARQKLAVQHSRASGLEIRTYLPEGEEDDGSMRDMMAAVMGAQQAAAEVYGRAEVRAVEADSEDIAWNAVVMGHPNRFADIPESVAFARQVVGKLVDHAALPERARPHAQVMLAGLLRYLWDTQNLNYLGEQFAAGQAGAVSALLEDIRANWVSPETTAWYGVIEPVARTIDETLAFIAGLSWEDVYQHLDPRMTALAQELKTRLQQVQTLHPAALAGCAAYVTGLVMAKNTFSPLDGSVPESIGERLTGVYHQLAGENEARFFAYLAKGFEAAANRPQDELARWRMEPDAGNTRRASGPPAKQQAKSSRPRKKGKASGRAGRTE